MTTISFHGGETDCATTTSRIIPFPTGDAMPAIVNAEEVAPPRFFNLQHNNIACLVVNEERLKQKVHLEADIKSLFCCKIFKNIIWNVL